MRFEKEKTKPLSFDDGTFIDYIDTHRNQNESLENFIRLTPEQKQMFLQLPLEVSLKTKLPSTLNIVHLAHYFSQELDKNKREENNTIFDQKAEYTIDKTVEIPFPHGVSFRNFKPIISYKEAYKPIMFQDSFIGAVYEIVLENQFPQVVPTQKMFANNHLVKNFMGYIKQEISEMKAKNDDDIAIADFYGPAGNETTTIRTIPEIRLYNFFIAEHFVAKNLQDSIANYQHRISSKAPSARTEANQ